jgi:hypothetical protein
MQNFSSTSQINFLEIEVSEEIDIKNLKKFISTSLSLNNKHLTSKDRIYLNYIKELKQYQIFILGKEYKYFDFQVFEQFFDKKDEYNEYNLYICNNFFTLYKNGICYYFQNIDGNIKNNEFLEYINKRFFLEIKSIKEIEKNYLEDLKIKYLKNNKKNLLKMINLRNDYSFRIYLFYITLLFFLFVFFNLNNEFEEKGQLQKEEATLLERIKNDFKFISLENKIKPIFESIAKYDLTLNSFEFKENSIKITMTASQRNPFYLFFEENKDILLSSSINYIENKNIYEAVINVRIF